MHFQLQQWDINKACVYTHTHMYAHTHTKYTCTPLCANYLSSVCIWLGCTACSPWARPVDIQAKINTRQLLGARDILVINSCVGLYNRAPPLRPPRSLQNRLFHFRFLFVKRRLEAIRRHSLQNAQVGNLVRRSRCPKCNPFPGTLAVAACVGFAQRLLSSACSCNCKNVIAYFEASWIHEGIAKSLQWSPFSWHLWFIITEYFRRRSCKCFTSGFLQMGSSIPVQACSKWQSCPGEEKLGKGDRPGLWNKNGADTQRRQKKYYYPFIPRTGRINDCSQ